VFDLGQALLNTMRPAMMAPKPTNKLDEQALAELRQHYGYEAGQAMDIAMGGFRWIIQPDGSCRVFVLPKDFGSDDDE
jgi:hypothetical protein